MKTQKQVIISIGREFGSAGHEIAERIAKRYGLSLYDHNLLREVADSHNVSSEELEIFDEMKHNKFLYRTVKGMSSSPADNVALMQFNFLREKAEKGESFVVVGRCSETILKDYPGLISIFVLGNMEDKIARISRLYGKTEKEGEVRYYFIYGAAKEGPGWEMTARRYFSKQIRILIYPQCAANALVTTGSALSVYDPAHGAVFDQKIEHDHHNDRKQDAPVISRRVNPPDLRKLSVKRDQAAQDRAKKRTSALAVQQRIYNKAHADQR